MQNLPSGVRLEVAILAVLGDFHHEAHEDHEGSWGKALAQPEKFFVSFVIFVVKNHRLTPTPNWSPARTGVSPSNDDLEQLLAADGAPVSSSSAATSFFVRTSKTSPVDG